MKVLPLYCTRIATSEQAGLQKEITDLKCGVLL
jgi:hypothetical protein